ncbi:MAG: TraM recognition domain-containing protein, partial [Isosphaeraceae bacterium]
VKEYGEAGRLGSAIMKLSFQRCAERRDVREHPRPTFLFSDEAHLYMSQTDQLFQTTARSQRVCTVYLFQNVDTLIASMGGSWTVRHLANSMLGNLATTVFHANSSAETNQWASERIGSTLRWLTGGSTANAAAPYGQAQATANVSESFLAQVFPVEFQALRSGGDEHDRWVDAIVTQQGRTFANGLNHTRCSFRQKERTAP